MQLLRLLCGTVFYVVRCTMKFDSDTPWPSEWIGKFVKFSPRSVGLHSSACEDNIADRVDFGVRTMRIDELAVPPLLFLDKDFGNLS